jgi:Lambda phage tail tube protein, TTP
MADVTGDYYANESGIGYGTELGVGQGDAVPPTTPETFVSVPVMMKITPGDLTTGVVDATHLRSPNRHREKKGTIRDSGAIVCEGFYVPGHGAHNMAGGDGFDETHNLLVLWQTVAENTFRITMPDDFDNLTLDLRGIITKYQVGEMSTENIVPFTLEITPVQDYFTGPAAGGGTTARRAARTAARAHQKPATSASAS